MKGIYLILIVLLFAGFSCERATAPSSDNEIAIYPTVEKINPIKAKNVKLQSKDLINQDDILYYNWEKHKITLKQSGLDKIKNCLDNLIFDTFAVVVNGEQVYYGTFLSSLSSARFDGPIINFHPCNEDGNIGITDHIIIENGYHSIADIEDFRFNGKLFIALKENGLLK